jgi:hypothetical protein
LIFEVMVYKNNSWYIKADFVMVITVQDFNVKTQVTNKIEAMTSSWAVSCVKSECISEVLVTVVLHQLGWVRCNCTGCPGKYCTPDLFV